MILLRFQTIRLKVTVKYNGEILPVKNFHNTLTVTLEQRMLQTELDCVHMKHQMSVGNMQLDCHQLMNL